MYACINCVMKILHRPLNGFSLSISNHQFSEFSVPRKNHENYGNLPKLALAQGLLHLAVTQIHEFHK